MAPQPFDLDAAQWATLRRLLDEALAQPPARRAAWLAALDTRLPAAERPLQARLQALLAQAEAPVVARLDAQPALGLETAAFAAHPGAAGQAAALGWAGNTVGPYRLLRLLGEGGMASVWLAERDDLLQGRQVALKLPRAAPGSGSHDGLARRLAREREILAVLEHPHIARLYDAGVSDDGRPYLAMEHVQGVPITQHCRDHALGLDARLTLWLQVCEAVAHAHARLVVHRDLKPGNILVTPGGQVRLLDFGIARLLEADEDSATPASALTRELGRVATLDYAAPEQLLGRPLGTAVDIYALGVLLFELLVGRRPYTLQLLPGQPLEAALAGIRPPRPSDAVGDPALRRALLGDLDTIVAKALQQQPAQRYASVDALAEDVQRHRQHLPLRARPASLVDRARRFVWRHRLAVGAGAVAAGALLGGALLALWQAGEARAQRAQALAAQARAEREAAGARRAERVADAQTGLAGFLVADLSRTRSQADMQQQLQRAARAVRAQYRADDFLRARLLLDIADRLRSVSDFSGANALFAEVEPLLRARQDHESLARLLCLRARDAAFDGRFEPARGLLAEAAQSLARAAAPPVGVRSLCLVEEAAVARLAGQLPLAVDRVEQARQLERQAGLDHDENHAETLQALARAYLQAGRPREAADAAQASITLRERIGRERSPGMLNVRSALAVALREGGRPLQALQLQQTPGPDAVVDAPTGPRAYQLAMTWAALGRHHEALVMAGPLLAAARQRDDRTEVRAIVLLQVQALSDSGAHAAARARLAEAQALYAPLRAARRYVARGLLFAEAHLALLTGEPAAAAAALAEAREILQALGRPDDPAWRPWHRLAARLALAQGSADTALAAAEAALAIAQRQAISPEASLAVADDLLLRARVRQALGQASAARDDALQARRQAAEAGGPGHPLVAQARRLAGG